MRKSFAVIVVCAVAITCGEHPTQPLTSVGATVSLAPGTGDGAAQLQMADDQAELTLPTGVCGFRLDEPADLMAFVRTEANGSRHLKVQDHAGSLSVDAVGRPAWRGKGRISVDWPDYPSGETFEMTMSATGSENGEPMHVSCTYQIANGVGIDWFVSER